MSGRKSTKKETGDEGETLAVNFLEKHGYKILERNFRAKHVEIDIVCQDPSMDNELVFVEVKTRKTEEFGDPLDAVSERKISHVKRGAEAYLYYRNLDDAPCRIDVISIRMAGRRPLIEHYKNAGEY